MELNLTGIEGLTKLEGPVRIQNAQSRFALPPGFDATKWASKWVFDGPEIAEAQQDKVLAYANVKAQGWAVWKTKAPYTEEEQETIARINSKDKPTQEDKIALNKLESARKQIPCTRVVGKQKFVLMYRPKALQQAINRIHAASSRALVNQELLGDTNQANQANDPGILTNHDLRRFSKDITGEEPQILPTTFAGNRPDDATTIKLQS